MLTQPTFSIIIFYAIAIAILVGITYLFQRAIKIKSKILGERSISFFDKYLDDRQPPFEFTNNFVVEVTNEKDAFIPQAIVFSELVCNEGSSVFGLKVESGSPMMYSLKDIRSCMASLKGDYLIRILFVKLSPQDAKVKAHISAVYERPFEDSCEFFTLTTSKLFYVGESSIDKYIDGRLETSYIPRHLAKAFKKEMWITLSDIEPFSQYKILISF